MSAANLKSSLIRFARSLGFERVGVTSASSLTKEEEYLRRWIAEGRSGKMDYMERAPERRARPGELLPGAKSVIAMAMSYETSGEGVSADRCIGEKLAILNADPPTRSTPEGRVARYAHGPDYHKVMRKRLDSFVRYFEAMSPGAQCRTFVDTGPLLERAFAQRAGLGFIGKNTMLIAQGLGSWVFLASVLTTVEFEPDAPDDRSCGECRLCIEACPTQAITEPFHLDARRCIAYQTIENDGPIPEDLRGKTGGWIFGCDICQEVCPHNSRSLRVIPADRGGKDMLRQILCIRDEDEFKKRFAGTAFTRAGREGLVRNACLAAANLGRRDLLPELECVSKEDPHEVVREQAVWALERLR